MLLNWIARKRAENKLTLNVQFIEIVYVALGPNIVGGRYEKIAMQNDEKEMKEISLP